MSEEKLMLLNFIISEYKDIMSDITLNEVVSRQYDDDIYNASNPNEFLEVYENSVKAKKKFENRVNYLEGKADAYEKILLKLNINPYEKL
jgi:hypothetical protein